VWTQIASGVTGHNLECVDDPIGPALAGAFLAGNGIRLFGDSHRLPVVAHMRPV
jgi:hypothetical protein